MLGEGREGERERERETFYVTTPLYAENVTMSCMVDE